MFRKARRLVIVVLVLTIGEVFAEDGYRLWLRYDPINNPDGAINRRNEVLQLMHTRDDIKRLTELASCAG